MKAMQIVNFFLCETLQCPRIAMTKCCSDKSPKFKDLATQTKQHHLLRSCRLLLRIRSYWCTLAMPRPKHPARRRLGSCLTRTGWAWDRLSNQGKDAPKSYPSHMSSFSHPRRVPTKLGVGTLSADGGWRGYCGDILQGYCGQEDRLICSPQSLPSHLHLGNLQIDLCHRPKDRPHPV